MSNWSNVNFSDFVPQPVTSSISAITNVIDQFLVLYKQALQLAKGYENSFDAGGFDILGTLVQAIVDTFEGLLQAGKLHALFVPMQKQVPSTPGLVPLSLEALSINLGLSWTASAKILQSGANQDYQAMLSKRGGNQGFYSTFVESLTDVFDPNRPQYLSSQDYVACTVLMAGAPSFVELVDVASALNRVFRPDGDENLTARLIPVPRDLRLKVIGLPTATKIGVRLDWSTPTPVYSSPYFPKVGMVVAQYAVIRSTNKKVTKAKSVLDFFATQNLTVGLTSTDAAQSSKVLAIGSGTTSSYVDDDPSLDAATAYYYCVAWRVTISEAGVDKTLAWDRVSSVQKTRVRAASKTANSKPPDWKAFGSMLDIMPDVAVTVRTALEQVKRIGQRNGGVSTSLSTGIKALTDNATQFGMGLDDLNARLKRLGAIFDKSLPGLYYTSFAGQGGNFYLMSQLATRLNDKSDPNRPPYDGNEYVIGVVLVGGGPRQPDVQPIVDFMQLLFGSSNGSNALVGIINAIESVVSAQEQKTFGPSLQPIPSSTGSSAGATPVTPVTPGAPVTSTVSVPPATFASDGTPIGSLDPSNPNAGFTGQPDPNADPC
jgi:hypothetical protein